MSITNITINTYIIFKLNVYLHIAIFSKKSPIGC